MIPADLSPPVPAAAAPADDAADLLRRGVAARHAGDVEAALELLERAAARRPDDADVLLQLGLARQAAGDLGGAEQALARAEALAPGYADVREARARIAAAGRAQPSPRPWRLDLWAAEGGPEGSDQPWRAAGLALGRRLGPDAGVAVSLEATERFGARDLYAELQGERRAGPWRLTGAVGAAPDADHRAELSAAAGAWRDLLGRPGRGLAIGLDARRSRYPSGDVWILQPGVRLEAERATLDARWVRVQDETGAWRDGWTVRGGAEVNAWLRLEASLADAPETSEGRTLDVRSASAGARFALAEDVWLRLGWTVEDRGPAGRRRELGLALTRRF